MKCSTNIALATSISILLAACGSGANNSNSVAPLTSTSPSTPAAQSTPVTSANLQSIVPAFTYSANSQELAFANGLTQFRRQIGLGLLAQNTKLDASATAHLAYVIANNSAYGGTVALSEIDPSTGDPWFHDEQVGKTGFTGVLPSDRDKVAGYAGKISGAEEGGFGGGHGSAGNPPTE